jgi:hypothetical protein
MLVGCSLLTEPSYPRSSSSVNAGALFHERDTLDLVAPPGEIRIERALYGASSNELLESEHAELAAFITPRELG